MTNRDIQNKLAALGNYDTRLAAATVIATERVEALNDRQIHAVRVSQNKDRYYLNFLAERPPHLPDVQHRSLVVEIGMFEPRYLSAVVKSLSEEQRKYPHAGCLERRDSFLARMLHSGKVRLIEARGIEFQDQDWDADDDTGFFADEVYFYGCSFQNILAREANLSFALFRQCHFGEHCNFDEALFCGSRFTEKTTFDKTFRAEDADCRYVDFFDATVAGSFQHADLRGMTSDSFRYLDYHWIWGGKGSPSQLLTTQFWQVDFRSAQLDISTHKALCAVRCPTSSGFLIGLKKFFLVTGFMWAAITIFIIAYRIVAGTDADILSAVRYPFDNWLVGLGILYVYILFASHS
jgi:hypothetical protein